MNNKDSNENIFIAHRLSQDVLLWCMVGGFGFLMAETVLPGIFSQRINFFFVYMGILGCMGATIVLGRIAQKHGFQQEMSATEKKRNPTLLFGGSVAIAILFVPVLKNMPVAVLPVFAMCLGAVLVFLSRELLKSGERDV